MTIENVTLAPIQVYSTNVGSIEPDQGYVIEATITNNNDTSCDVSPSFSVLITDTDNYGDARTRRMMLTNDSEITSPYHINLAHYWESSYLVSVGVAPKEKKTVRYYLGTSSISISAIEMNENGKINTSKDVETFYRLDTISMSDVKLLSYQVAKADYVYVPVEQWGQNLGLEEVDFSMPGLSMFGNILTGSITNSTQDRWESVNVQFDLSVNGQTMNSAAIAKNYQEFHYVDIGDVLQLSDGTGQYSISQSVASYEKQQGYQVKVMPAILAYTPDREE